MQRGGFAATLPRGLFRGVESVAPKIEAFRAILAAPPAVETRAECRRRR